MNWLTQFLARIGFYGDRARDPWLMVLHAQTYLISDAYNTASTRDRGCYLPHQLEALVTLEEARNRIGWQGETLVIL